MSFPDFVIKLDSMSLNSNKFGKDKKDDDISTSLSPGLALMNTARISGSQHGSPGSEQGSFVSTTLRPESAAVNTVRSTLADSIASGS